MCGIENPDASYHEYTHLYFWLPIPGYFNVTTCVKKCPEFA